ncbi:hypothetical protein HYT84_01690 [Candidatus Micrarchaeota archaeon]|nr:hypothetical protein [Candidatus Micrarchaeota archaeon]
MIKEVDEFLEKNYKETMTVEDVISLGITALKKNVEAKLTADNVEVSYVDTKVKKIIALSDKEIAKYLK